jgi:hypothetical protein
VLFVLQLKRRIPYLCQARLYHSYNNDQDHTVATMTFDTTVAFDTIVAFVIPLVALLTL